jgi:hypothetical protein
LNVFEFDLWAQGQVAMDMDFKGGVVATHDSHYADFR